MASYAQQNLVILMQISALTFYCYKKVVEIDKTKLCQPLSFVALR